ncbi:hypothetical protein NMY3_01117 [Candidatus Nitrosocosmicus oleophilus]|uniref:Uncharacterized protein n=1 Tax=Candidatus Nitrosocosmicus oleophilus TaxID=1353260 RepID=A0A654M725_9ARCH|nr:hypothetical protein NMY3_01117 [Candidatus Nitrosocosmicus oleophilus]
MKNPIITANTESYKTQYTVAGRLTATEPIWAGSDLYG